MLGAFFHLTDTIIGKFAKQYVKQIRIDSLPLWKGQAVIDNINLNTDGINQAISDGGGTVVIENINVSRLSVKAPFYSPGTQPIKINLHSAEIRLSILPEENQTEPSSSSNIIETEQPQQQQPTENPTPTDNQSYLSKLTSNILIIVDGVFLQLKFNGFDIRLVATNLQIHILPNETKITAEMVRGSANNETTNLKLNLDKLVVDIQSGDTSGTIVEIINATAQISDTFDRKTRLINLIDQPISLNMFFGDDKIVVKSDSDINLSYNMESIPSLIKIINSFAGGEGESSPLPNICLNIPSITITFNLNNSFGLILKINQIDMSDGSFSISSISIVLRLVDTFLTIIDPFSLNGTLKQCDSLIYITASIDSIHVALDINKDLLELIKTIEIPQIPSPPPQETNEMSQTPKKISFIDNSINFSSIPNLKISNRIVEFMFDEYIIPILFHFDDSVQRAKLQLRVWDSTFQTFIAVASFESSSQISNYRLPDTHLLPGKRWQLIFPEPISSFPGFVENSVLHFQTCQSLLEGLTINANIGSMIVSLSSYDYPIAGVSITKISATANISSSLGITVASASLGISASLTNFRNSTMSSILDIPDLSVQFSMFPELSSMINNDVRLDETLSALPLQQSYSCNSTSINAKIPSIHINAVPTIIVDFVKFLSTFSVSDIIAYRFINETDIPFTCQLSDSSKMVTINPSENIPITFQYGQLHYVKLPLFQTNIVLNTTGYYHLSDLYYIEVKATSPFSFTATILSSIQFINKLKAPLEISVNSASGSSNKIIQNHSDLLALSIQLNEEFSIKMRLSKMTDWSQTVRVDQNALKKGDPMMFRSDVINMLPQRYVCTPNYWCWMKKSETVINCNNGIDHKIVQFTFTPLISLKNHLDIHIITSFGTIPPKTSLYLSSMPNNQIIINTVTTIDVGLPLQKSQPLTLLIDNMPAIIDTIPSINSIVVSPSFLFKNKTGITLVFKFTAEDKIFVEPNETKPLTVPRDPDWLSIGLEDKEGFSWSPPIQIPASRDFTIKTSTGNLVLFGVVTEYSVVVTPKTVAINESKCPILLKSSFRIDPGSQTQLLLWRGSQLAASFGFSKNAGFTKPISLNNNIIWKRKFVMNDAGQSLYYLTYSIQTNADPHAIIFHDDPSPPFTVVNHTPLSLIVFYKQNTIMSAPLTTIFLPSVPEVFAFGRIGTKPATVSLQFPQDLLVDDPGGGSSLYLRVERRGNQVRVTISQEIFPKIKKNLQTFISAFITEFKIFVYDDFCQPGFSKHILTVTMSPISLDLSTISNEETKVSFSLDTLEIDQLAYYVRFPSLIRKVGNSPLLSVSLSILNSYGGGIVLDKGVVHLHPINVCIEECFIRFLIQILSLIPEPPKDSKDKERKSQLNLDDENEKSNSGNLQKLTPIYVNYLRIKETKIILSLATESFIHADFRNVPINLSVYILEDTETFDMALAQVIISHYISDALAAIPSLLGSLSLIGSPVNIINQSIYAIQDFYRTAFFQGDSILQGIGQGSMNIVRGVTMGTLESFVGLAYSLEKSLSKLKPPRNNPTTGQQPLTLIPLEETADENLGPEMARAISGLVTTPIREFSQDGLLGLAKGAGLGIIGVFVVPAAHLFGGLKRAGSALLEKVGGRNYDVDDCRIEKTAYELPTIRIDNDEEEDNQEE